MDNSRVPFRVLYKESFRFNPLYDWRKFEVRASSFFAVVLTVVACYISITTTDVSSLVTTLDTILSGAAFGLMGLLGFTISGLAIISGTIGTQATQKIIQESKFNSLRSILFSFWYIGFVTGLTLACLISVYFILMIKVPFVPLFFEVGVFIMSYFVFFCVFFAVSLLGTCIEIFKINYIYSGISGQTMDYTSVILDIKIQALMSYLINSGMIKNKDEFVAETRTVINSVYPEEVQKQLIDMIEKEFK